MVAGQNPGAQFTTVTLGCEENGRGRGSIRELRRTNTQNELSCLMRRRGIGFPLANTFASCGARGVLPCTHLAIAQTHKRRKLWLRQLQRCNRMGRLDRQNYRSTAYGWTAL